MKLWSLSLSKWILMPKFSTHIYQECYTVSLFCGFPSIIEIFKELVNSCLCKGLKLLHGALSILKGYFDNLWIWLDFIAFHLILIYYARF